MKNFNFAPTFQFVVANVDAQGEVVELPGFLTFADGEEMAAGPFFDRLPTVNSQISISVPGTYYFETAEWLAIELCLVPDCRETTVDNFGVIAELLEDMGRDLVESWFQLDEVQKVAKDRYTDGEGFLDLVAMRDDMREALVFDGTAVSEKDFVWEKEMEQTNGEGIPARYRYCDGIIDHLFEWYTCDHVESAVHEELSSGVTCQRATKIFWDLCAVGI